MIFTFSPIHQMSQTFTSQQNIFLVALEIFSIYMTVFEKQKKQNKKSLCG